MIIIDAAALSARSNEIFVRHWRIRRAKRGEPRWDRSSRDQKLIRTVRVSRRRSISGQKGCFGRDSVRGFAENRGSVPLYSPEFHARLLHLSRLDSSANTIRFLAASRKTALNRRANAKPAWSTYPERLNIYKQWSNGSLADRNGSDTLLPWLAF